MAVYFALGLEEYSYGEGLTENLVSGGSAHPDVLNSSWRDYGNRVGAWRILEAFRQYRISALHSAEQCRGESAPELVRATREQECELIAHGYSIPTRCRDSARRRRESTCARSRVKFMTTGAAAIGLVESVDRGDRAHT